MSSQPLLFHVLLSLFADNSNYSVKNPTLNPSEYTPAPAPADDDYTPAPNSTSSTKKPTKKPTKTPSPPPIISPIQPTPSEDDFIDDDDMGGWLDWDDDQFSK